MSYISATEEIMYAPFDLRFVGIYFTASLTRLVLKLIPSLDRFAYRPLSPPEKITSEGISSLSYQRFPS